MCISLCMEYTYMHDYSHFFQVVFYYLLMCMCVYVLMCLAPLRVKKRGQLISWSWICWCLWVIAHGDWAPNPNPLPEQQVFLTAEEFAVCSPQCVALCDLLWDAKQMGLRNSCCSFPPSSWALQNSYLVLQCAEPRDHYIFTVESLFQRLWKYLLALSTLDSLCLVFLTPSLCPPRVPVAPTAFLVSLCLVF